MTPHEQSIVCCCGNPKCDIPYGLCHCRCGNKAAVYAYNRPGRGIFAGNPKRYFTGHQRKICPVIEDAQPFKIDGVYCRLIPLTQGLHTIVWESDYRWLMQWKWSARENKGNGCYYAIRNSTTVNGKRKIIMMHRVILGIEDEKVHRGDHKDSRSTLDNRRSNLRFASPLENTRNARRRKDNTSGLKGVFFHKIMRKWASYIQVEKKRIRIGYFETKELAYAAYCKAAKRYFGEFACLN